MLFNEEVIRLAWISLSAAFIKGRHSQAIRDTGGGGARAAVGTRDGVGEQIVKQIRRGGGSEQEVKKREKSEMRPQRRKPSRKQCGQRWQGAAFQAWMESLLCS